MEHDLYNSLVDQVSEMYRELFVKNNGDLASVVAVITTLLSRVLSNGVLMGADLDIVDEILGNIRNDVVKNTQSYESCN